MKHDIETIKIKHKDGYQVINKEDYNEKEHQEYKEPVKKDEPIKEEPKKK